MGRLRGLSRQLLAIVVTVSSLLCISVVRATRAPHIIFILADDLGRNDVSFNGCPQIPTGNIDAMAWNGLRLTQYYTQPLCTPSRAALMTGRYPIRTGMQHFVLWNEEPRGLPLSEKLLPQWLADMGYDTHLVGKWHLGFHKKEYTPLKRGFRHHFGYWGAYLDYYNHTKKFSLQPSWRSPGLDLRRQFQPLKNYSGAYLTDLLTDEAVKIIRRHPVDKPLFLYVAHQAPHSADSDDPLQAPDRYTEDFEDIGVKNRTTYAGMVKALDLSVGAIFQALARKRMLDDSVIVFSSDNGANGEGPNANYASSWPLKGQKGTPWEGGVWSPAIIWSPLLSAPERATYDGLFHITDWLPTFYHLAGGNVSNLETIDGINNWKSLLDLEPPQRTGFLINLDQRDKYAAIREGNFKLVRGVANGGTHDKWYPLLGNVTWNTTKAREACETSTVADVLERAGKHPVCGSGPDAYATLVTCGERNPARKCNAKKSACLFDLSTDACEYNNVADQYPEVLERLTRKLARYEAESLPPGNLPLDPRSNPALQDGLWASWDDSPAPQQVAL